MEFGPTQLVRDYVRAKYVEPALRGRKPLIQVVAGEVHRELNFRNRVPLVCQALTSRKFLTENDLTLEKVEGPPSGLGSTATFFYRVGERKAETESPSESAFIRLRGAGKEVFRDLGGGEQFLHAERAAFYRSANPRVKK